MDTVGARKLSTGYRSRILINARPLGGWNHRLTKPRCDREKPASTAQGRVISGIGILHCKFLLLFTKKGKQNF